MPRLVDHVLIGGSGFIATHLRETLRDKSVLLIDQKKPRKVKKNETFARHDIRDQIHITGCVFHPDTVIHHLAAVHFDFQEDFYETNVTGTKNVIAAFCDLRRWVFYSSVAVYGESNAARDESSQPLPSSCYGKSKLMMEQAVQDSVQNGILQGEIAIVRPGVVYGEWNFGNVFNLMWFSSRFLPVGLNSNPIKSMAYVQNLVSSTFLALNKCSQNIPLTYNYVDYHQLGTKDLLHLIAESKATKPVFIPLGFVSVVSYFLTTLLKMVGKDFVANPMRVKKLSQPTHFMADKIRDLGFIQPVTPNDAVKKTIDWISSNDIKTLRLKWKAGFKE